jgi:aldehyde:ferredoxin oxidoreductase
MMKLSEFGRRMAHVDLTAGRVEVRPSPGDWVRKYIGGRGLGVRYVLENGPEVAPLSPANILCFMNGPLSGSEANMSGRWAAVTKSPLTGTVTDSHQGGWAAARLRWAGFREGSDRLPDRFLTEPSTLGGSKGHVCELDLMLADYYRLRGWQDAVVPESKLRELEIL